MTKRKKLIAKAVAVVEAQRNQRRGGDCSERLRSPARRPPVTLNGVPRAASDRRRRRDALIARPLRVPPLWPRG